MTETHAAPAPAQPQAPPVQLGYGSGAATTAVEQLSSRTSPNTLRSPATAGPVQYPSASVALLECTARVQTQSQSHGATSAASSTAVATYRAIAPEAQYK